MIPDNRAFQCIATLPVDFSEAPDSFSVAIEEKGFRVRDPRITYSTFPGETIRPSGPARVDLLEFPPECSMRYAMCAVAHYGLQCLNVLELAEIANDAVLFQMFSALDENGKTRDTVHLLGLGSVFCLGKDPEQFPVVVIDRSGEIMIKEMLVYSLGGYMMPGWLIPVLEK
ncbi:MAG TPA: hypothetical protein DEF00_03275 [Candidatus Taylorbacteria bacterium]|nr:MAG: hypothetical protein UY03_C0021G0020 [Parcubacteria group bacterium GW2011_GWA2_47_64]KKU95920.1 MAG: hypothetical protein UY29_C0018G0003 [Parcubacteria group bacterium GW2011_GWC2_48_17]HBV01386.1 hypothetical protein [Candidatus Taylorbacteria bacterium]